MQSAIFTTASTRQAPAAWSLNERLTLPLIRAHTKTSDIMHVTDEQLDTYRATAVEQAELYTGLVLDGFKHIEEMLPAKEPRFRATTVPYKTRHPVADGMVYYTSAMGVQGVAAVEPGGTKFYVPAHFMSPYNGNIAISCCDPCGGSGGQDGRGLGSQLMVEYNAGYSCAAKVPEGIILGCLKFISWSVEHSGDMLITMASTTAARDSGITGTNNGLWASGALELFRAYVRDGF